MNKRQSARAGLIGECVIKSHYHCTRELQLRECNLELNVDFPSLRSACVRLVSQVACCLKLPTSGRSNLGSNL